jgi:D-glycerate 3-kinase
VTDDITAFLAANGLPPSARTAVEQIHAPLADWIAAQHAASARALVVGLCGAQGGGKSTAALAIRHLLEARGLRVAALSLDDLYLTRAERLALASTVHPLLATRGPAGTHDIALGEAVIASLSEPGPTAIPSFDKAIDDRRPRAAWPVFEGSADIILFEGWCVGAVPEPAEALVQPINALERDEDPDGVWRRYVNAALAAYQPLFASLDKLILLKAPSFAVVERWRGEQEAKLRAAGEGSRVMTDVEVARFIQHYERLTRAILAEMPARADALVELGEDRERVRLSFR